MSALTPLQELLRSKMSDVSEDCYCAGWMQETEYAVWELANGRRSRWGQCDSSELQAQVDEIRELAERIGFWIVWDIDTNTAKAVPLAEWVGAYELGRRVAGL